MNEKGNTPRQARDEGPRISRGEIALYGDYAFAVRQLGLAFVAVSDARDVCVDWLSKRHEDHHPAEGEKLETFMQSMPEGSVAALWVNAFSIVAKAEKALEQALFEMGEFAMAARKVERENVASLQEYRSGWQVQGNFGPDGSFTVQQGDTGAGTNP